MERHRLGKRGHVTGAEIAQLLAQYRAGIEAELTLLRQLCALAERQKASSDSRHFEQLSADSDDRDRVTRGLVALETDLTDIRHRLSAVRTRAAALPDYAGIVEMRQQAAALVSRVLSIDQDSLRSLADAEMARRAAMTSLEKGETTLAAYRKVLTPPVEHAALLDRRG